MGIRLIWISLFFSALLYPPRKMKVWLIGDSTMADKAPSAAPETGWGMPFERFFDSTVEVDNRAKNGRSTKSFFEEGLWKPVVDSLQPGDYVLIQFGHNDEVKEKVGRYTTPEEFAANLKRYIDESRAKGAIPVLLTPVARRQFDSAGRVRESHPVYADLVRSVARQEGAPLIDHDEKSKALLQEMGVEGSKSLYNQPDNTHFSPLGARKMAGMVREELKRLEPGLSHHFRDIDEYSWDHLPVIARPFFRTDTVDIRRFGAIADGATLNTRAINGAIADCHSRGGGVVLVPPGLWITGPIVMASGVNLHISRAAVLQFTADHKQYPILSANWEGHAAARCQSPISGTDLENIGITGEGIIDGNGEGWRWIAKERLTEEEWKHKLASGGVLSADGKTWFPSEQSLKGFTTKNAGWLQPGMDPGSFEDIRDFLRPNLLVLTNCKKVLLSGPTFQNSAAWCLHTLLCEDLTIGSVHVRNPWNAVNGDGLDLESCRNVLVENSVFDCGDDGICIKSGRDEEGRKRGRPTENVIVRNNTVYRAHGGFVIGSEMSGGARNIFVSDCFFNGTDIGLRFKTVRGRGGVVEKIYIKNISMKDILHQAVFLDMYYFSKAAPLAETYGKPQAAMPPVTEATPQFRDIHISNIVCDGAEEGIFVRGLPEMNIREIYLENMVLKADKGVELTAARNITLNNIRLVTAKDAPLIYVENSRDLQFHSIRYDRKGNILFSINGDQCGNIRIRDTDTSKAAKTAEFHYGAAENALEIN